MVNKLKINCKLSTINFPKIYLKMNWAYSSDIIQQVISMTAFTEEKGF